VEKGVRGFLNRSRGKELQKRGWTQGKNECGHRLYRVLRKRKRGERNSGKNFQSWALLKRLGGNRVWGVGGRMDRAMMEK